jgi:hypothetical protein
VAGMADGTVVGIADGVGVAAGIVTDGAGVGAPVMAMVSLRSTIAGGALWAAAAESDAIAEAPLEGRR